MCQIGTYGSHTFNLKMSILFSGWVLETTRKFKVWSRTDLKRTCAHPHKIYRKESTMQTQNQFREKFYNNTGCFPSDVYAQLAVSEYGQNTANIVYPQDAEGHFFCEMSFIQSKHTNSLFRIEEVGEYVIEMSLLVVDKLSYEYVPGFVFSKKLLPEHFVWRSRKDFCFAFRVR